MLKLIIRETVEKTLNYFKVLKRSIRVKKIIKIVIKGCSGYGPIDAAYKDKVIIDSSSISYEYTPLENSETNPSRKWKYTTTGSEFKRLYDELVGKMPNIIYYNGIII